MTFTAFQISALITAFVSFFFGISVYSRERTSKINLFWFLISISTGFWSIGLFGVVFFTDKTYAWISQYVLDVAGIWIPIFFFNFILYVINKKLKKARIASFVVGIGLSILSFTDLFKTGISSKFDLNFWIDPGKLYFLFPLIFVFFVSLSIIFALREYFKTTKDVLKRQLKYILLTQIFGFGGGVTNFFPQLFNVYPFGNYLVILYVIFMSYAALKYRLFNIKVIATELLTLALWIFLLLKVALSETIQEFIINGSLLIMIFIFGALLVRSVWREVKQREQMEILNKKVQKAYLLEKKARAEIEKITEAKTQFIMATQHHLRTPLTSMLGYMDLIFGGTYGKVSTKLKDPLQKFQISTKRLIRIVNTLLDISQFQMGKEVVTLQPGINFEDLIKEVMEELQFEVKNRGLYLKYNKIGEAPKISADPEKLKVALFNVIDNAIKYTKEGGITVTLQKVGNKAQLSIKDTGIGLEPAKAKVLFGSAFVRGKEAKKVHGFGRGIGVYITGHIINAHKGKIWAESEGKGRGTTFIVELLASK